MRQVETKMLREGKVEVIASFPLIEERVKQGYSLSFIHRYLIDKKLINIGIAQFFKHVRKLQRQAISPALPHPSKRSFVTPSSERPQRSFEPPKKKQTFKHNPLPQQDYFASSSKTKGGAR